MMIITRTTSPSLTILVALAMLVACAPTHDRPQGVTDTATALTVSAKLAPDTLVQSDGKRCTVSHDTFAQVEIGQPYPCDWR